MGFHDNCGWEEAGASRWTEGIRELGAHEQGPEKLRQELSLDMCGWDNTAIRSTICETGR